jgi:hypothetical protein
LKENYFVSHEDIQVHSDNSISLPHCGDGNHLCKHPKTLLVHARLYDFATRHGLDQLRNVSLNKLYWTLGISVGFRTSGRNRRAFTGCQWNRHHLYANDSLCIIVPKDFHTLFQFYLVLGRRPSCQFPLVHSLM